MTTVMLIVVPKGAGSGFAGRPLKNLTSGTLALKDGSEIPVDNDIFTKVAVGAEAVVDGKTYTVHKVSVIMPGMGKIVLESQE